MTVPANPPVPLFQDVIPCPWSLAELRDNVERHRNRPLTLTAVPLPRGSSGLWISTATADLIIYSQAASPAQQLCAIGHQVAHLLLGHQAVPSASASPALFPHLDPALVATVLTTWRFAPVDEMAADEFAALVAARALPASNPLQNPRCHAAPQSGGTTRWTRRPLASFVMAHQRLACSLLRPQSAWPDQGLRAREARQVPSHRDSCWLQLPGTCCRASSVPARQRGLAPTACRGLDRKHSPRGQQTLSVRDRFLDNARRVRKSS